MSFHFSGRLISPANWPGYRPLERVRRQGHSVAAVQIMDDSRAEMLELPFSPGQERFLVVRFFTGPRSRRAWSSSAARSEVIVSTESEARRLAFVSPSVTDGPNRPSFT